MFDFYALPNSSMIIVKEKMLQVIRIEVKPNQISDVSVILSTFSMNVTDIILNLIKADLSSSSGFVPIDHLSIGFTFNRSLTTLGEKYSFIKDDCVLECREKYVLVFEELVEPLEPLVTQPTSVSPMLKKIEMNEDQLTELSQRFKSKDGQLPSRIIVKKKRRFFN